MGDKHVKSHILAAKIRMEWAKVMIKRNLAYWKKVVFTDESKIKISGNDGRVFVWRKSTEEWMPCCTLDSVKTGEASIMVWGSMSYDGIGPLTVVETNRQILQKHFLPLVVSRRRRKKSTILQDDNAPVPSQSGKSMEREKQHKVLI